MLESQWKKVQAADSIHGMNVPLEQGSPPSGNHKGRTVRGITCPGVGGGGGYPSPGWHPDLAGGGGVSHPGVPPAWDWGTPIWENCIPPEGTWDQSLGTPQKGHGTP